MFSFKDQRVIITGGTRGIGKSISESFLSTGATVIATYKSNQEAAASFKEKNQRYGEQLQIRQCDVTKEESVIKLFEELANLYSSIEILVNNSGIRKDAMVPMMDSKDFTDVVDTNLVGTFLMSKYAVLEFLKNRYGRIINISSVGYRACFPGQANYSATKAGQIAFSKSLAKEVAKKKITVNNVLPGFIETELISDLSTDQISEYKKSIPVKRFGKPEEVAHAVLFLASKESSYITGSCIEVSGGL